MRVNGADSTHVHYISIFSVGSDWLESRAGGVDSDVLNRRSCILSSASCHEQRYH